MACDVVASGLYTALENDGAVRYDPFADFIGRKVNSSSIGVSKRSLSEASTCSGSYL
jgi:hypothetical protein